MGEDLTTAIKVILRKDGEKDVLEFCLKPRYILNLNRDDQDTIKSMFCALLLLLKEKAVSLELEIEEGFDSELMKEVATDYIKDLNEEISNVRVKLLNEYKDTDENSEKC